MSSNNNQTIIQPYLFFDGRCEEALEFYKKTVGAQVEFMMRFKDSPETNPLEGCAPSDPNKIMHANVKIGGSVLMVSDGRCEGKPKFEGFSLSYTCTNEAEAKRVFTALSEGGSVMMPLGKTFFSPAFGMLSDKFGVPWMVFTNMGNA